MRLRDLGGLIVVDFIDMEESKNRREVEKRLRDALRQDRARVQFSSISKFGLLELSRQRLRPALSKATTSPARAATAPATSATPKLGAADPAHGAGESMKDNTAAVHVQVPVEVTSFLLNEKRTEITKIEAQAARHRAAGAQQAPGDAELQARAPAPRRPRLENLRASYTMIEEPDGGSRHHAPREGQGQARSR